MRYFWKFWIGLMVVRVAIKHPESFFPIAGAAVIIFFLVWLYQQRRQSRANALLTHVPPAEPSGILFIESDEPLPSDSRCLLCRQPLATDVIYCVNCHTPHHRECFRYLGSCSVYACRKRAA